MTTPTGPAAGAGVCCWTGVSVIGSTGAEITDGAATPNVCIASVTSCVASTFDKGAESLDAAKDVFVELVDAAVLVLAVASEPFSPPESVAGLVSSPEGFVPLPACPDLVAEPVDPFDPCEGVEAEPGLPVPALTDEELLDGDWPGEPAPESDDVDGAAKAIPWPANTAPPTPRATARPPIRLTHAALRTRQL